MPKETPDSVEVEKEEVSNQESVKQVSQKAYEQVSTDMHKYKRQAKEAAMKSAEIEAQLKSMQESDMREKQQWQELSDKYKSELEEERTSRTQDRQKYLDAVKRGALKDELKGVSDKYLVHADINGIELNESGIVDRDSLLSVANRFREENPELIKATRSSDATSQAAPVGSTVNQFGERSLDQMSIKERQQLLKSMKTNN